MSLLSISQLTHSYGGPKLFDNAVMHLDVGERVSIIGRNGEGKSTLLKMIAGEVLPDEGEVMLKKSSTVTYMPQEVPTDLEGECDEYLRQVYLQEAPQGEEEWEADCKVDEMLSRLNLKRGLKMEEMSAGQKRRICLGAAVIVQPDILVLDEPTNHLDIPSIQWMENFLLSSRCAIVFVTHDRSFLRKLATSIVELDRGILTRFDCSYDIYLARKEELLNAETSENKQFDKKLSQEEKWIRQGIKARRTRNEGRVRALKKMREERAQRRDRSGSAKLSIQSGSRSGDKVILAEKIVCQYDGDELVSGLDLELMRGDKVGIIGPNGCGKSTLIKHLLKERNDEFGSIKHGTNLIIAYFDQLRGSLDPEKSLADNINPNGDTVSINGRSYHVISYLQDFLFPPERVRGRVKVLSGGEKNRLLLAKLFAMPFNVLVLDEPTNDLDTQTLELLEEKLAEFDGTLLLVSHDRAFLNNVVSSCLVFEGNGVVKEYIGGYDDWQRELERNHKPTTKDVNKKAKPQKQKPKKISFKEKKELEELPAKIEALETEQSEINEKLSDGDFYKDHFEEVEGLNKRSKSIEEELLEALERWEYLESLPS